MSLIQSKNRLLTDAYLASVYVTGSPDCGVREIVAFASLNMRVEGRLQVNDGGAWQRPLPSSARPESRH